jgi:hypothetical protein
MPQQSQNKVVHFVGGERFTGSAGTYKKLLQLKEAPRAGKKKFLTISRLWGY